MVKVNNKFSFSRYTCGWELHETKGGTSKTGEDIDVTQTTFFSTLEGILHAILTKSSSNSADIKGILAELTKVKKEIIDSINLAGIEEVCRLERHKRNTDSSRELDEPDDDEDDDDDEEDEDVVISIPKRKVL